MLRRASWMTNGTKDLRDGTNAVPIVVCGSPSLTVEGAVSGLWGDHSDAQDTIRTEGIAVRAVRA